MIVTEFFDKFGSRPDGLATFLEPDLVAAVQDLMAPDDAPPLYYLVLEASYSIDDEDIIRATDHAKIVNAVTGLSAYAVVAGVRLDERITDRARIKPDAHKTLKA